MTIHETGPVDPACPRDRHALTRATIRQKKTGRPVTFEITDHTRTALDDYFRVRKAEFEDWVFPARGDALPHFSTRQYSRLVQEWVVLAGLNPALYGTHSLRRTKATLIYKKTGNLRAVQLLLGHTKIESTVRYLGVEVDDALEISEQLDV
jgi:integrase